MSIKVGGIDITQSALDSEFKILVLEKVVDRILQKLTGVNVLSDADLERIRTEAFNELQKKYPDAGLKRLI